MKLFLLALSLLAGCHKSRALDPAPIVIDQKLPAGEEPSARFDLDTGGDQMSAVPVEVGLRVIVRLRDRRIEQRVASCADAGRGSALGSGDAAELDAAGCDGDLITLSLRGDHLLTVVQRRWLGARVLSDIHLPAAHGLR